MTMREIKKLAKAAGYPSAKAAAAAGWKPGQTVTPKSATVAPTAAAKSAAIDRTPGVHEGRIETGSAQYWDDDAARDARYYD